MSETVTPDVIAIVPAAGLGRRFGHGQRKQFVTLGGMPVLDWVLRALEVSPRVREIILAVREDDFQLCSSLIKAGGYGKALPPVAGGRERQDSVYNALKSIKDPAPFVLVHDGVRPFLSQSLISNCIAAAEALDGAIAAVPPKDTIKQGKNGNDLTLVSGTLDRSELWAVQTPQVFRYDVLMRAYDSAMADGFYSTDDSALVERAGGRVGIVMGSYSNIKVTTPEDMDIASAMIGKGVPE